MNEYIKDMAQLYNSETEEWIKINTKDTKIGEILGRKKGKPYKNVRIYKSDQRR